MPANLHLKSLKLINSLSPALSVTHCLSSFCSDNPALKYSVFGSHCGGSFRLADLGCCGVGEKWCGCADHSTKLCLKSRNLRYGGKPVSNVYAVHIVSSQLMKFQIPAGQVQALNYLLLHFNYPYLSWKSVQDSKNSRFSYKCLNTSFIQLVL